MAPRFTSALLNYIINALAVAIVVAVLGLIVWIATGTHGNVLTMISDALFLAGGVILAFGALIEFFHLKGTKQIRRMLFISQALKGRYAVLETADKDQEGRESETGWPFIWLGALLIAFSIAASLNYLI